MQDSGGRVDCCRASRCILPFQKPFVEFSRSGVSMPCCGGRPDHHDKACLWPQWVS